MSTVDILMDIRERLDSVQEKTAMTDAIEAVRARTAVRRNYTGICPMCGSMVTRMAKYCHECGQALAYKEVW